MMTYNIILYNTNKYNNPIWDKVSADTTNLIVNLIVSLCIRNLFENENKILWQ